MTDLSLFKTKEAIGNKTRTSLHNGNLNNIKVKHFDAFLLTVFTKEGRFSIDYLLSDLKWPETERFKFIKMILKDRKILPTAAAQSLPHTNFLPSAPAQK